MSGSSNQRCVDSHGLVHYSNCSWKRGKTVLYTPWCSQDVALPAAKPKRAFVTCFQCMWERRRRGGKGALLGDRFEHLR